MKIVVFGSTGSIGKMVVEQALAANHHVTAFLRDPAKLSVAHPNLTLVKGDVMNIDDVKRAVEGHDAVVCTLGAGAKGNVRAEGTKNIIEAMNVSHVKRLICQSSLGVGDSRGNLNFFW